MVTFETDLKDLEHFDYVPQIPLEALFKNMAYKQAKYDQGFQQAQRVADSLKVPAYGQDAKRRDQLIQEVNKELEKFSGADFSDPAVVNQFTSYVSGIASSPEFVGFQQRANWYDKAQAKLAKLTADGTDIPNEDKMSLVHAENYFAGGERYNPNKRFTGDIYKPYDFTKFGDDVFKAVTETEERETGQKWITATKEKQYDKLNTGFMNALQLNTPALNALRRKFDAQTSGIDYNVVNKEELNKQLFQANQSKNIAEAGWTKAKSLGNRGDMEKYQAMYNQANTDLQHINALQSSGTAEERKNADWQQYLKKKAYDYAMNRMYYSTTEQTSNPYTLDALKTNLDVTAHALTNAIDLGQVGFTGDPSRGVSGITLTPMTDASGNAISGAISATKPTKIQTGKGELDYAPTVQGLNNNDPNTMKVVFGHVQDKFPGLEIVDSYYVNPNKSNELVVTYFPTEDQKKEYYDAKVKYEKAAPGYKAIAKTKMDAYAPSQKIITSEELLKTLGHFSTKVGIGVYKAANVPGTGEVTSADSTYSMGPPSSKK